MAKSIPQRMCIGCGCMNTKNDMMRVIKTSDGNISLDLTMKMNGRGAYLCKNEDCLNKAIKSKGLERSFKMAVTGDIYESLKKEFVIGTKE